MTTGEIIAHFLLAAALGGLIGMERQVGRADRSHDFAGLRTFALYSVWGAGAAYLGDRFTAVAFAAAAAAFGGLIVVEYWLAGRRGETGTTTEAAAFAAFVAGVLVWSGEEVAATALAVGVAAVLQSKAWVHGLVGRFSDEDMRAVLRFGVLTAVILPLVPDRRMGPFAAINPREIWLMVVLVAGIGLAGYVTLRLLGPRGLAPTGLIGGLVSSTAVTLGFSRMSRRLPAATSALAAGVVAASGLMYVRVLIETFVVEPEVGRLLVMPLVVLFCAVEGIALVMWWRSGHAEADQPLDVRNPVTLTAALQFGALYGAVVLVAAALVDRVSEASLSAVAAISGINDVDAITLATANLVREGKVSAVSAAQAVLAAATVNTLVKAALSAFLGGRRFRLQVLAVLGPAAAATALAWMLV